MDYPSADEIKRGEVFESVCLRIKEWFPDFLLIVRESKSGIRVKRSDVTWAFGAIKRFEISEDEDDRIDQKERRREA